MVPEICGVERGVLDPKTELKPILEEKHTTQGQMSRTTMDRNNSLKCGSISDGRGFRQKKFNPDPNVADYESGEECLKMWMDY